MNTKVRSIAILVLAFFLIAALFISIFTPRQVELESSYRLVMGTFARVVVVAKDTGAARKCIEAAFAEIDKVGALMSDYKNDSEISLVNQNAAKYPVKVSESTFEVLQRSVEFSRLTDGAFDITVGPLVDLFRAARESKIAPGREQIDTAKSKAGYEKLILDPNNRTVRFTVEGMRLDLGGIAKGYSVDKAIEAIQTIDALGAMVNVGGEVRCFGVPAKGKNTWLIGIQDPNLEKDQGKGLILTLKLSQSAVSTSGDYQQFVIIDGKQYSHIIDRRTGTNAEGLTSVTIIAENATDTDALATAVSVMGAEKGLALIEKLTDTEAILVSSGTKPEIIKTKGAEKFIE